MLKNPVRQEITFTLVENDEEHEFTVRPTLAKISAIEAQFGPASPLCGKVLGQQAGVAEMCGLVAAMLRGAEGAPKEATIRELVYDRGAYMYVGPVAMFLLEATKGPSEPEKAPAKPAAETGESEAGN